MAFGLSCLTECVRSDVLSAGLDAGVAVSVVVIFFTLYYPKNGTIGLDSVQVWWGNTVSFNTADANKAPLWALAKGQKFGYVVFLHRSHIALLITFTVLRLGLERDDATMCLFHDDPHVFLLSSIHLFTSRCLRGIASQLVEGAIACCANVQFQGACAECCNETFKQELAESIKRVKSNAQAGRSHYLSTLPTSPA